MKQLKHFILFIALLMWGVAGFAAEIVYSDPAIVQQSSQNIVIYYNSAEGTGGLKGYTGDIYAHTGVITSESNSDSDWKHAPSWGDNSTKYKLTKVSTDLWKLNIGTLKSYYGLNDGETVRKMAFVFRNADGSKEGKATGGSDIFLEVHPDGLSVALTSSAPSGVVTDANSTVTFSVNASQSANLSLYINDTNSTPIATANNATQLTKSYNFPVGDYDVIAKAEANGSTVTDVVSICHRSNSVAANYSGTLLQGANKNADGSVTFCLYAPKKSNVILVGEWDDYRVKNTGVMNYQGNKYFWLTLPAGKLDMDKQYGYYFIVDDEIMVADPCAKLILDPWNDKWINEGYTRYPDLKPFPTEKVGTFPIAVFQGNGDGYKWQVTDFKAPAKNDLIIYELLLRDFTKEQCLESAMEKLDYLVELGVNAIELMPIQEFDGNNSWGYNPNFYFAPDKYYGTSTMYKTFIDECHKRGIAVILDIVFNHTWGQHPWCKMYWGDGKPAADNPFYNVDAPHNWSVGNDWKQESAEVQNHLCDVLKFWLKEYKVDGYRFDLVKGLGDSNSYSSDYDGGKYNASRVRNVKRFIDAIKSVNPNGYCILEGFLSTQEENELGNYGAMSWKKLTSNYAQAAMGYQSGSSFKGMYSGDENRPFGSIVSFQESHDEERVAYSQVTYGTTQAKKTVYGMRRLSANAAFMILVPGPKMIWQFGEMGYDISGGNGDTSEKEPHWEYLDNSSRKGLHDCYAELIHFRLDNPDLFSQEAEFYWSVAESNWDSNGRFITARNRNTGKELVVAYNPGTATKTYSYTFDNPNGTYYIFSKSLNTVEPVVDAAHSTIKVPAHCYVAIANFDYLGVEDATIGTRAAKPEIFANGNGEIVVKADDVKSIELYSITGQLVARSASQSTLPAAGIAAGSYIVRATTPQGVFTAKVALR